MATSALTAKALFADGETYNVTFSPYDPSSTAVNYFKANVMQFNGNAADYSDTFISTAGAAFTKIDTAQIVTTTQEVFYTGGGN